VNISIDAINDDPSNTGSTPIDIALTEDIAGDVDLSAINLADVDAGNGLLTITLSTSAGGNLTAATNNGVTASASGAIVTLEGSLADLNTYLDDTSNIQYLHANT